MENAALEAAFFNFGAWIEGLPPLLINFKHPAALLYGILAYLCSLEK